MNQGFALKSHVTTLVTFYLQARIILKGIVNPIDNGDPVGTRCKQAHLQRRKQRFTIRPVTRIEIFCQIVGAHNHPLKAGMGGNFSGVKNTQRRFHHRPNRQAR